MIILALVLMTISLVVFIFMNRQREALWLTGLFFGFAQVNVSLLFFYSKMGGLVRNEQILFFLTPAIQNRIQHSVVTLDTIARILIVGRYTFAFFVLAFSLDLIGMLKKRWWLATVTFLWPLCSAILLDPFFFRTQSYNGRVAANLFGRTCISLYIAISLIILVREYFSQNIRWVKRQLRSIMLFVLNLIVYFLIFGRVNPASVISAENYHFFDFGATIHRLRFSISAWVFIIVVFMFFIFTGLGALFRYAKVNLDESRSEISLERQLSTANMGTRVFIHGMKNQLLSERILLRQMTQQLEEEPGDREAVNQSLAELHEINETMFSRIEALYKVFKQNSMVLVPCRLSQVIELALSKAQKRLGNIRCVVDDKRDCFILGDLDYLSEALYNILINAVDAILASERADQGRIDITIKNDYRWCAIRVDDNGIGMDKSKLGRIFEPFYTDKNTNYSWGVGLSYVKQIAKYHFGKLRVESQLGQGSTFIVAFPKYTEPTVKKPRWR